MDQANGSRALDVEQKVVEMERQVARRLGSIDAGIQEAFGQVREGDFVRRILRSEIQKIVEEQKAAEEQKAEDARMERLDYIRGTRRKRISYLLAGVLVLGGSAYGWKAYKHPERGLLEAATIAVQNMKEQISEVINPKELPPLEGQIKMWVSPDEASFLQAQREQRQKILELSEELTHSQLQYQGWQVEPEDNPRREQSLEYWEQRIQVLEAEIRIILSETKEKGLQPAPSSPGSTDNSATTIVKESK